MVLQSLPAGAIIDHVTLRDTARDSVLSRHFEYAYIPVSKAANTNVKRLFWQIEHEQGHCRPTPEVNFQVHNFNWRFARKDFDTPWVGYRKSEIPAFYRDLLKRRAFTVVRNPFVRLLSGYLEKIAGKIADDPAVPARFQLPAAPRDFADFVHMVCDRPDPLVDIHFRGQSYACLFDFVEFETIGYVEKLAETFAQFSQAIFGEDMSGHLSRKADHAANARAKLHDHYTPALQQMVYARFREDFLNFGYDYDLDAVLPSRPAARPGIFRDRLQLAADICGAFVGDASKRTPPTQEASKLAAQTVLSRLETGQGAKGVDDALAVYARKLADASKG